MKAEAALSCYREEPRQAQWLILDSHEAITMAFKFLSTYYSSITSTPLLSIISLAYLALLGACV